MLRLSQDHYKALARLKRQPDGRALLELLQASLDDAQVRLRTATGERIGWAQGEAQCLAELITHFEAADQVGR